MEEGEKNEIFPKKHPQLNSYKKIYHHGQRRQKDKERQNLEGFLRQKPPQKGQPGREPEERREEERLSVCFMASLDQ